MKELQIIAPVIVAWGVLTGLFFWGGMPPWIIAVLAFANTAVTAFVVAVITITKR